MVYGLYYEFYMNRTLNLVRKLRMSLGGAEVLMAIAGLWAVVLRPLMIRYAVEMSQMIGISVRRFFSNPLSPSVSFFYWY